MGVTELLATAPRLDRKQASRLEQILEQTAHEEQSGAEETNSGRAVSVARETLFPMTHKHMRQTHASSVSIQERTSIGSEAQETSNAARQEQTHARESSIFL